MRMPSLWAIVVLLIVILVLFGASRLPDIAASVGKSLKIFKREIKELTDDDGAAWVDHAAGTNQAGAAGAATGDRPGTPDHPMT